jgi:hypothetical protein
VKKNYTFSNLPMAAIVLLVASLPCLAQATASESSNALAVADNIPTQASSRIFRVVPNATEDIAVTSRSVEHVKLSAATFQVSSEFSTDNKYFSKTQIANESYTTDSREQFRLDDDNSTKRSNVTFVPSRGFKLPN